MLIWGLPTWATRCCCWVHRPDGSLGRAVERYSWLQWWVAAARWARCNRLAPPNSIRPRAASRDGAGGVGGQGRAGQGRVAAVSWQHCTAARCASHRNRKMKRAARSTGRPCRVPCALTTPRHATPPRVVTHLSVRTVGTVGECGGLTQYVLTARLTD